MKVFTEEQKFNSPLIYIGLSMSLIIVGISIFNEWKHITNTKVDSKIAAFSGIFIVILVIGLFTLLKLKTKIDEIGIHYQFYPFHLKFKTIKWNEITKCHVRKYDPIWEYGGWGLKFNFFKNKNKCVTVKGTIGLQLELINGTKLLIGTQLEEPMKRVIETYNYKIIK